MQPRLVVALCALCATTLIAASPTARAGEQVEPKTYQLSASVVPAPLPMGATGTYTLTVLPEPPWVMKAETPIDCVLKPAAGLAVEKARLSNKDLVDPKATAKSVTTRVTGKTAGRHALEAEISFFLCTQDLCKRSRDVVRIEVEVK